MRLVFASNNAHKLEEVRAILGEDMEVLSLREVGFAQEIDETGETLEENSLLKAQTVWKHLFEQVEMGNAPAVDGVFADDTGLEIEALGGKPGVHTARWAADEGFALEGEGCTSGNNRRLALKSLAGKNNRRAQFRTVVTYIQATGFMQQVEGIVQGHIALEEKGGGGFGYDPIFVPEGYKKTFAELPSEVKNGISHRAHAMEGLKNILLSERK